jgi:hypothetical protein
MSSMFSRFAPMSPRPVLAAGLFAAAFMAGTGATPAAAQQQSWEIGCSQPVQAPGSGDLLRVMNCARQKDCQELANARGTTIMESGCFMVAPSAAPVLPQAGKRQATHQQ